MQNKVNNDITEEFILRDPQFLKSLINKTVELTTTNDKKHKGLIYVIDPESESIVLLQNGVNASVIMGHAITSIKIIDPIENDVFTTDDEVNELIDVKLPNRKKKLKDWLEKNQFEVEEEGMTLKIADSLIIHPPYDADHCISNNTIILERIQNIINEMPNNENS